MTDAKSQVLCTVVCDDFESAEKLPPVHKLEVCGFGAHSFLEGETKGGCFTSRTIWWIGFARSRDDAIQKCRENFERKENDRR